MAFKKGVICFGSLLVYCIISLFFSVVYSVDTSAATLGTSSLDLHVRQVSMNNYTWINNLLYNQKVYNVWSANQYQFNSSSIIPTGNYASLHFETNIVYSENVAYQMPFVNLETIGVWCSASAGSVSVRDYIVNHALTHWYGSNGENNVTLTVYGDVSLQGFSSGTATNIYCGVGNQNYAFIQVRTESLNTRNNVYFEQNPATIEFTNNVSETLLQQQIYQNNLIIEQNQSVIDQNNSAYDAISGQDVSDIPDSTNSQTTSLIGVISNFISSLSSYNATSCSLTLPFPNYAGGTTTVDPCSGKEIAPTIVQVASSLLLICTFVPLAFIVLRMIYNEIRSWTNG